ncbi:MAG TPA: response regulator [Terriglobales bacterium]|nr:response regulator [Terriglobales bacterium]
MITPVLASPLSEPIRSPHKKKRVLLVDTSPSKRDLRAEAMRRLGMEVDCAADISEARSWWRADLYNLVLINVENELGHRNEFCEDMRRATPSQQLAFLVGKPEYLADAPRADGVSSGQPDSDVILQKEPSATRSTDVSGGPPQCWGILEASQRISAVRSAFFARSKAMQERPAPPRDPETRLPKAMKSPTLDELLRKEMQ